MHKGPYEAHLLMNNGNKILFYIIKLHKNKSRYSQIRKYRFFPYKGIIFEIELFNKHGVLMGGRYGII
jgi:hypothetical protein